MGVSKKSNGSKSSNKIKRQVPTSLTNEELLEQIMSKKRNKSNSKRKNVTKKIEEADENNFITENLIKNVELNVNNDEEKVKNEIVEVKLNNSCSSESDDMTTKSCDNDTGKECEKVLKEASNDTSVEIADDKTNLTGDVPVVNGIIQSDFGTLKINTKSGKKIQNKKRFLFDKNKFKIGYLITVFVLCLVMIFILFKQSSSYRVNVDDSVSLDDGNNVSLSKSIAEESLQDDDTMEQDNLYNDCLNRTYDERDNTEKLKIAEESLSSYISLSYNASISFKDLRTGYTYNYNQDYVYYAASTIKLLDALYIYTKAASGEINLDDVLTYTSLYNWGSSKAMENISYGTQVSIRNLVKYAIVVSDNAAHHMLVDYIGYSNLQEFGKSLGATYTLVGGDYFGSITSSEGLMYLEALNQFIENNSEFGTELKSYFLEAEQNDLSIYSEGILAAHKYGQYDSYYHDLGIVYASNPYLVAILTLEGKSDYEAKVQDINEHVYQLSLDFYANREEVCQLEVYGH